KANAQSILGQLQSGPQTPRSTDETAQATTAVATTAAANVITPVTPPSTTPKEKTTVDNVRYWETQNSVRIVVDVSGEFRFIQGQTKAPKRVYLDVSSARLNAALVPRQWAVKSAILQLIRIAQFDNNTVRVVLTVGASSRVTSVILRDPDRLVIDILNQTPVV